MIYTSGSTGRPKGVLLSHQSIHDACVRGVAALKANEYAGEHFGAAIPFSFVVGIQVTLAALMSGLTVHLGDKINAAGKWMQVGMSRFVPAPQGLTREEFNDRLVTAIVLFCASGTGIYGAIVSGMNGDESVLLAKSVLDLPTALIFACTLGAVVSLIALPQLVIFLLLYYLAGVIFPLTTPAMIGDFKACGGLIVFVTGFRMIRVKDFPVADMIPAMVLVMPISWFWTAYILPVLSR